MTEHDDPQPAPAAVEDGAPADGAPEAGAKPELSPAAADPTAAAIDAAPPAPEREGLDPQLLAIGAVLWILALAVFAIRWEQMRVDWELGNLREAMELSDPALLDAQREAAMSALIELAQGGVDVPEYVKLELANPAQQTPSGQLYRVWLVRTVERIPGEAASALLEQVATDYDPRVRTNALLALVERERRGLTSDGSRGRLYDLVARSSLAEPIPRARAECAKILAQLGDPRGRWPLLCNVRDLGAFPQAEIAACRSACYAALKVLAPDGPPLDLTLSEVDPAQSDAFCSQFTRWEDWLLAHGGEPLDPKERAKAVVAARAQERASEPPAAEGPKDGGQGAAPDAPSRSAVETSGPTGQD